MAFRIAARTILELGAELISSDAVAVYELVKNAIDAGSKDGVAIQCTVTLLHSDFQELLERLERATDGELTELKRETLSRALPAAEEEAFSSFRSAINGSTTIGRLRRALTTSYFDTNFITFSDSGCGMSRRDLLDAFLVIGTPSRKKVVQAALRDTERAATAVRAPFLGEKGIGRLAAMRLGSHLRVETATAEDSHLNILDIDWTRFETLDSMLEQIEVAPTVGGRKPSNDYSGTVITIRGLRTNWSRRHAEDIAGYDLAKLSDPFSPSKRRFRIAVLFNGDRIDIPRLDRAVLDLAHAQVSGRYDIVHNRPQLEFVMKCQDLGYGNPPQEKRIFLETIDVRTLTKHPDETIPPSALRTLGAFTFDVFWYNRQRLRGVDSIGNRARVLELQRRWAGIMLFRDGYRVYPYGEEYDDWLNLDREALASSGYKLNKQQFIGHVAISRIGNSELVDQTNREGLKDCPEKRALVELLRWVIQERLGAFFTEISDQHRKIEPNLAKSAHRVEDLEKATQTTIRHLRIRHPNDSTELSEILAAFEEMKQYFDQAKMRAQQVEDERQRMVQLAGVGLMLEVVAHELARATEFTLQVLDQAPSRDLPDDVSSVFRTLRAQMKTMNKRLRVLDPLSVSARQTKQTFNFKELVEDILDGHQAQFERHRIKASLIIQNGKKSGILLYGVKGMFVQIVENLLSNSVYWLKLRREAEDDFRPRIDIAIGPPPIVLTFTDNGPGIQPGLRDEVFKAFFSTKDVTRRQGLGLFIARECANYHGGNLYLSSNPTVHKSRLNTFLLEMPEGIKR